MSVMKKILAVLILVACACGCAGASAEINVVCSLFPQYDFARVIAGEHAKVTQLLPPGMDSHEYEPSARDMLSADEADLFIYTDQRLEGWVENIAGGLRNARMISAADGIDLEALNEQWNHEEHDHGDHDHGEHAYDAHIWLDPALAIIMCENIRDALCEADAENSADYVANCTAYTAELRALDERIASALAGQTDVKLYFGGKFAYSHFLRRYGIAYVSAYADCSDEGEPGARRIVEMVEAMRDNAVKAIFTDEMSSGDVAEAIAKQTGARVLLFHTAHNLSAEDRKKGLTYLDIMNMNLENILAALS